MYIYILLFIMHYVFKTFFPFNFTENLWLVGLTTVAIFFSVLSTQIPFLGPFPTMTRWPAAVPTKNPYVYTHIKGQSHTQWISKRVKTQRPTPAETEYSISGMQYPKHVYKYACLCGMHTGFCRSFVKPLFAVLYTRLYSCVYVSPLNIYVAAILYIIYI